MDIHLNAFQPRDYQLPIIEAIEKKGYRRVLAIMPRRAGKDITAFNIAIRYMLRNVCVVYYIFPTYAQGKKILWDSLNNDGMKILDYIPSELIESKNGQEMKIKMINGSLFQVVGSDNVDSLVGTNPKLCIFSEYALQDPRAFQYIRPILAGNEGLALFVSTPRGHNHLFDLYNIATNSPDWFCYKLTLDDTKHIPLDEIERDRDEGLMSEDLIQQEYYCSFALGIEGSFYTKYIDKMRISNQIGQVPWDSAHRVNTAWDIGVRDSTCIIFYQSIGQAIRIIDCYENNKEGLEHYKQILDSKPYSYAKHFAPHDIAVTEWGSGLSRLEKAKQLGINFEIKRDKQGRAVSALPDVSIMDGIEAVRSLFSRLWIDEVRCAKLIKALENYRQEYDAKRRIYGSAPLHNWASHFADCTRYLALSLPKTRDGLSSQELDNIYTRAVYGNQGNLPPFFRDTK
jgi:phage terminase large subunit